MKTVPAVLFSVLSLLWVSVVAASASNSDWKDSGFSDGNWNVANNWSSGIPGRADTTGSGADMAFFKFAHNLDVMVDETRSINSVVFDYQAGRFTLDGGHFYVGFNGYVWVKPAVTNPETVYTPIYLSSVGDTTFSFINTSTNANASLTIGGAVTGRNATGTVTVMLQGYGNGSVSGSISDGTAGGKIALTKNDLGTGGSGPSTWIISGQNTYSGPTSVTAGTLLINGDQSGAKGAVTVSGSGTTLGGIGTVGGSVTVNGTTRLTGAAAGSTGALTLQQNVALIGTSVSKLATYFVDLAAGANNSDRLIVRGLLDLSSIYDQIQFSGTPDGSSSYILATANGGITGRFDYGSAPSGYKLIYGSNQLTLEPVPEPSTWAAGILTVGAVTYSQRKRVWKRGRRIAKGGLAAS